MPGPTADLTAVLDGQRPVVDAREIVTTATCQCQSTRAMFDQSTGTADGACMEGRTVVAADVQRRCAQGDSAAGNACQAANGLVGRCCGDVEAGVGTAEIHRARSSQAAARTQCEGAAADRGAAAVCVDTAQGQRPAAPFFNSAGAFDHAVESAVTDADNGIRQ
ncbi:hypothetical protein D3C81_632560 [compost metagenome]